MPAPTFALAKLNTGVPPKVTVSEEITPDSAAEPLTVAAVVRSYDLFTPLNPLTVNVFAVIAAVRPAGGTNEYFHAWLPDNVSPLTVTALVAPTVGLENTPTAPTALKFTESPETTPTRFAPAVFNSADVVAS